MDLVLYRKSKIYLVISLNGPLQMLLEVVISMEMKVLPFDLNLLTVSEHVMTIEEETK